MTTLASPSPLDNPFGKKQPRYARRLSDKILIAFHHRRSAREKRRRFLGSGQASGIGKFICLAVCS
jgi:hypothetical protein